MWAEVGGECHWVAIVRNGTHVWCCWAMSGHLRDPLTSFKAAMHSLLIIWMLKKVALICECSVYLFIGLAYLELFMVALAASYSLVGGFRMSFTQIDSDLSTGKEPSLYFPFSIVGIEIWLQLVIAFSLPWLACSQGPHTGKILFDSA